MYRLLARNVFIGGTSLDTDQVRAGDMLGLKKSSAITVLRELNPGEFFCFGSAIQPVKGTSRAGVHLLSTREAKTTHPKAGQRLNIAVPKASTQIERIARKLGDLPQEVANEETTIKALQDENARLKRELTSRPVQVKPETRIERVEVPILTDDQIEKLGAYAFMLNGNAGSIIDIAGKAIEAAQGITTAIAAHKAKPVTTTKTAPSPSAPMPRRERNASPPAEGITNPEQRILDAIAWFESIGITEPRQEAVAFLAGYTFGGGAFNNPRGRLNTRGFVSYRGKSISLTDEGRQYANAPSQALTKEDLHSQIMNVLPRPHQAILSRLLDLYPDPVGKEALSEMVGKRGGAFNNPLGRLRSIGLIDYPEPGMVVANSFLFME